MTHHEHTFDPADHLSQEFWDDRYRSTPAVWSGEPNPHLVEQAVDLEPGDALDVGSGEGADAIWLAGQGWHVTGIDVSPVALQRAAERAASRGPEVAQRISWRQADVLSWEPGVDQFDLVSAQFMHVPGPARESLHRRLAGAVRPGGTLLVVGHHPSDLDTTMRRPNLPDLLFTAEQVATTLDPGEWQIHVVSSPQREAVDSDGRPVTIRDAVLTATRRP